MRAHAWHAVLAVLAVLAVAHVAGCATATLDRSELRGIDDVGHSVRDVPVHGFEIEVWAAGRSVEGELLAIDQNALWVQTALEGAVRIPRASISHVRVHVHDTYGGEYGGWTLGGVLDSATHGWFVIFSAPLWGIIGTSTSVAETASGRGDATGQELDALYPYARFPRGPPLALTGEPVFEPSEMTRRYMTPVAPTPVPPPVPVAVPEGAPVALPAVPPAPGAPSPPAPPPAPVPEIPRAPLWYEAPGAAPPAP